MDWIDAKTQPPKANGEYLVAFVVDKLRYVDRLKCVQVVGHNWCFYVASFQDGKWLMNYDFSDDDITKDVGFYLPIPAPPIAPNR